MKQNNLTEKESLELITRMIQQTKQTMQIGSGNLFLYYGYTAVVIAALVYLLCSSTTQMLWHSLWFLMFVPLGKITQRKQHPTVVTYIDKAISNVWIVISALFVVTALTILVIGWFTQVYPFVLMLPLALLYVGIGTACTGVITNDKSMTYFPVVSFVISIYMLVSLFTTGKPSLEWNLLAGLSFIITLVIPGHILNRKSQKK